MTLLNAGSVKLRGVVQKTWAILKLAYAKWQEDEGTVLAAAMAYYASLSLLPLLLIVISLFGVFTRYNNEARNQQQQLIDLVSRDVSPWVADHLAQLLSSIQTQAGLGGPFGILTLLLAAIGVFVQFEDMFIRLWGTPIKKTPGFWGAVKRALYDRLSAFLILLGLVGSLVALFIAGLVMSTVRTWANSLIHVPPLWILVQILTTTALYWLLFTAIYRWLPASTVRWSDALGGGLSAAIGWQLGQQVFERFVIADRYSAYGVVGAFIAVMLWMFYASHVIFFGAEIVQAFSTHRHQESQKRSQGEQAERAAVTTLA